jgi:hypothetical protein
MSIRTKMTMTCDRCGKKVIEYLNKQSAGGDPRMLPEGWSRYRKAAFLEPDHWCDDCTFQRRELNDIHDQVVDNWRMGGITPLSIRLYGIWAGRDSLVTDVLLKDEGS